MTKTFIITLIFAISFSPCIAQNNVIDSLKNVLATTTKPSERFNILVKILEYQDSYQVASIDSLACTALLKIAQEQKNEGMLATAFNWIGYYLLMAKGDNTTALEYYFKAMPLAEKIDDKRRISSLCFDIANVYNLLQNNNEFLKYTLKGGENLPDKSAPMYDYMLVQYERNMARYFLETRQLDSALYYVQAFTETSDRSNLPNFKYQALIQNGNLHAQLGVHDLAEAYFQQAMAMAGTLVADTRRLPFYKIYIPFLISGNRMEDAKFQTQEFWEISQRNINPNFKLSATGFKRELFERLGQIDSAYYFSRLEADTRELIFNQNNQNLIQSLAFKEQLRSIEEEVNRANYESRLRQYALLGGLGVFSIIALLLYRNNISRKKANEQLQKQKSEIEVQKRNVEEALAVLKATQSQLIQSEKMASLGELTAGIAHEIQNPLNFVNNFSELNKELIDELNEELEKGNIQEVKEIASNLRENETKIIHHGKRADAIVKGMLEHSKSGSGEKELTNINTLAKEYLNLTFQSFKSKNIDFNGITEADFDESLPQINLVRQDIGRVLLNLINNALYAVSKVPNPLVTLSTKNLGNKIQIVVSDNGTGIPDAIKDKIFQPFFTTKPTGQGTGLGLSLAYDIVKAHGGEVKVNTTEGEGSEFIIQLNI